MFEFLTYAAWFSLGSFFGIVCTFAWVEYVQALSMEEIAELGFTDED